MTALTLRDVEAADRLALARFDDDGAPAVASVVSSGSAKNARILAGAAAGAPAAIPGGPFTLAGAGGSAPSLLSMHCSSEK